MSSTLTDVTMHDFVALFETNFGDGPNQAGTFQARSIDEARGHVQLAGGTRIIQIDTADAVQARMEAKFHARITLARETGDLDTLWELGMVEFEPFEQGGMLVELPQASRFSELGR